MTKCLLCEGDIQVVSSHNMDDVEKCSDCGEVFFRPDQVDKALEFIQERDNRKED